MEARPVPPTRPSRKPHPTVATPPSESAMRALLSVRLASQLAAVEQAAAEKAAAIAAAEAAAKAARMEASRVAEGKQRALLAQGLAAQQAAYDQLLAERAAAEAIRTARQQPKDAATEQSLQSKYGAIDCVGERAFAILMDLGMVQGPQVV